MMLDCIRPRSISKFHDYVSYKTIFGNTKMKTNVYKDRLFNIIVLLPPKRSKRLMVERCFNRFCSNAPAQWIGSSKQDEDGFITVSFSSTSRMMEIKYINKIKSLGFIIHDVAYKDLD